MPKIWVGGRCFIIGGGPSLYKELGIPSYVVTKVMNKEVEASSYTPYFEPIMKEHVIGVNMAYKFGDWIDIIFFGDEKFWNDNKYAMQVYKGLVITCNSEPKVIKHLQRHRSKYGICLEPNKVCWNGNSGAAAINLAVHTGVKQIILLGFDMALDTNGNQHWHKYYNPPADVEQVFQTHLVGFAKIAQQAKQIGVEILNANPESRIKEFRKVHLSEVL